MVRYMQLDRHTCLYGVGPLDQMEYLVMRFTPFPIIFLDMLPIKLFLARSELWCSSLSSRPWICFPRFRAIEMYTRWLDLVFRICIL